MSKQVTDERSIQLAEGAMICVQWCEQKTASGRHSAFTELRAYRGNKEIKMRVDHVPPRSLSTYLELVCREIARRRLTLNQQELALQRPKTLQEFVNAMAAEGMFIDPNAHLQPTTGVPEADGALPKQRVRKNNKRTAKRSTGSKERNLQTKTGTAGQERPTDG